MSSIPIKAKTGHSFLSQDELGIGQFVWDHAHPIVHRFGFGSGDINPRFYPGVDKLGNVYMLPGTFLKPQDSNLPDHTLGFDNGDLVFKAYGKEVFRANQLGLQVSGAVAQTAANSEFLPSQTGLAELLFPLLATNKTLLLQLTRPAIAAVDTANKFYAYRSVTAFLQDFNGSLTRGGSADVGSIRQVGGDLNYQTVLGNQPRITYSFSTGKCLGLLIEAAATNAAPQSADLANWPTKTSIAVTAEPNTQWSAKGLNTPVYFVESQTTSEHSFSQNVTLNPAQSIALSAFFQAKPSSVQHALSLFLATPDRSQVFGVNITVGTNGIPTVSSNRLGGNGSVTTTELENVGSGIYRIKITGVLNGQSNTPAGLQLVIASLGSTAGNTSLGFTPGANDGNWCLLGDVQAEQGAVVTSYIQTGLTALTRNRELLTLDLTKTKYSPVEGLFEFGFRGHKTLTVGTVLFTLTNASRSIGIDYYIASVDGTNYTIGSNLYQSGQATISNPSVAVIPILRSKLTITYANLPSGLTQFLVDGSRGFTGTVNLISYE
jgi:hypothetical protein